MNPLPHTLEPSLLRAVHERKRPGDVDLGLGEPVLPPPMEALEEALEWVRLHGIPYSPNPGFWDLREAIAAHYGYPGLDRPENVCVTVGSEEAIYLALRMATDPARDEVLIVEPAYPVYTKICTMEGLRHRTVSFPAEHGFAPDADRVLEALREDTRVLLICSPCNPTGRVWSASQLERLAQGLQQRSGPPTQVIFDEVYRELYFGQEAPVSLAAMYPHTWVVNSLSKSHALTGLRIGFLIAPREAIPGVAKIHHLIVTSPGTLGQRAALSLFRNPPSFHAHRGIYARRRHLLLGALDDAGLPYVPPEATFYCMVKLEGPLAHDSVAAAFRLIDEFHVVTVPGRAFGPETEGWIRLSWVSDSAILLEGVRRIREGCTPGSRQSRERADTG